jgi:uncharacterized protein (DUF2147 family)
MRVQALILAGALMTAAGAAQAGGAALGDWITQSGSAKVHIAPCGSELCGAVVWMRQPLDPETGQPQKDERNPDPALRGRTALGLQIIHGMKPAGDGHWAGGTIYDPQTGRTYASKLSHNPDGTLKVEGCIAILCQAQTWKPAS